MPHPLEHNILIKIRTIPGENPIGIVNDSIQELKYDLLILKKSFQDEYLKTEQLLNNNLQNNNLQNNQNIDLNNDNIKNSKLEDSMDYN
jgi:hypothetical protein